MARIINDILMVLAAEAKPHWDIDSWRAGRVVLRDVDDEMKKNSFVNTFFDNDIAVKSQRIVNIRHAEGDSWDWVGGKVRQVFEDLFDGGIGVVIDWIIHYLMKRKRGEGA